MPKIEELALDPAFAKLPYADQVYVRGELFKQQIAVDPKFQALPEMDKQYVADQLVYAPPVLESGTADSDYARKAYDAVERLKRGDMSAVGQAQSLIAWRTGSKATLLPSIIASGVDTVRKALDPSTSDLIMQDYYGGDGDKINDWLSANLGRYAGEAKVNQAMIGTGLIAGVGNIAEFLGATLLSRGAASGEFASTAVAKALAATKPFIGWSLASKVAPRLASTAVDTGSMTLMDIGRRVMQQEAIRNENGQFWNKIAQDFGQNVAWDVIGWGMAKAGKTLMTSLVKTGRGFGGRELRSAEDALAGVSDEALYDIHNSYAGSKEFMKNLLPAEAKRLQLSQANYNTLRLDPRSELGFNVAAASVGYQTKWHPDGSVSFKHATDSTLDFVAPTSAEARDNLAQLLTHDNAATIAPAQATKELASAQTKSTRLVREAVAPIAKDVDPSDIAQLLKPQQGHFDAGSAEVFAKQWLRRAGVDEALVNKTRVVLDDSTRISANPHDIMLPKTATSLATEHEFTTRLIGRLEEIAKNSGKEVDQAVLNSRTLITAVQQKAAGSYSAVDALAGRLGYKMLEPGQGQVHLVRPDGAMLKYPNAASAQAALIGDAVQRGIIDDASLASMVSERTGYMIRKSEVPLVQGEGARKLAQPGALQQMETHYQLAKPTTKGFQILDTATSMSELLSRHPEMDVRLPSTLAPTTFVVDPIAMKIKIQENVAMGSSSQLLEMAGNFGDTQRVGKTLFANTKGKVIEDARSRFRVVNDNLGVSMELGSASVAMKKLRRWNEDYAATRDALSMKGVKMMTAEDGSIIAYDATGQGSRFKTIDELKAWTRDRPIPAWIAETTPVAPDAIDAAQKQLDAVVADKYLFQKKPSALSSAASMYLMPTEQALVNITKRAKNPLFLRRFREAKNGFNIVEGANARAGMAIHRIFTGTSKDERLLLGAVAQRSPSEWDSYAKQVFGYEMTPLDKTRLTKLHDFYDEAFKASGIDDWKKQLNYLPRIREWALQHGDEVLTTADASEVLQRAFPQGVPGGFNFFGENLRATDLVHMAMIEDPEQQALSYIYALNKKRYMDPIVKAAQNDLAHAGEHLRGYNEADVKYMADTLMTMKGVARTHAEGVWREVSKQAAQTVQGIMRKLPGLKHMEIADEAFVGDIFDMANRQMTLSTQATPWAMIRNIPQITFLGALINDNGLAWKSSKEVVEEPATQTINRVIRSGAVQDSLFSHGMQFNKELGMFHRIMKWSENMDIASRSAAFKAADTLIDRAWSRYQKQLIDLPRFVKEAKMTILDEDMKKNITSALLRGDVDNAKFTFGDQLQKLAFMDYSTMQKPLLGRGVLGKAFGKFMTYPSGTLALYQRIMTSGDIGERLGRIANVMLTSMAMYEGFKAIGIDYQGFMWTDPFGFSGGPLWSVLVNGSQVIGNGPEASMARQRLLNTLPKMVSPGLANVQRIQKAFGYFEKGDTYSGSLVLSGAPVRRDALWTQLQL